MARFEIDVKLIVDAEYDDEAYRIAIDALRTLVRGSIVHAAVDAVTDLEMEAK